ncbi:hypothetical protein [Calothrix rhizosoleniae]|uniref:hypothetical protein n=1 Tax=Calothrix rhizosoleniae TaxID=888997 RepID=UPI000B49EBA5|nr:hypothetical protein [Calothrix rhizosoleniae]
MRYSLGSHFRGTFVGICLGDTIPFDRENKQTKELSHCQLTTLGAMSLIEEGRLDLNHWQSLPYKNFTNSYRLLLVTLPVALFFHDNCLKLRQNLLKLLQVWQVEAIWQDITLAFAYAIAQSITEKLHPSTLNLQIISFIGETSTILPQKLLKLNSLLEQRAGLARVKTELGEVEAASSMIATTFYCCLSTLEDFTLAIRRSRQTSSLSAIPTLVAALSAAYNSTLGIPVSWQGQLSSPQLPQWQLNEFGQMLKLADVLLAHWSGLYELHSDLTNVAQGGLAIDKNLINLQAIAAPDIIR